MYRQPGQKVYVPAPDYDDVIPETPEPDLPVPEPDYEAPVWREEYQYSSTPKAVTPPQSRHSGSSQKRISRGSLPPEFREHVRRSSSQQSQTDEPPERPTRTPEGTTAHRDDSGYGSKEFNNLNEYEYRIDRLVPSPEPPRRTKDIKEYIRAVGGVPVLPPPMPKNQVAYPQSTPSIDPADNLAFQRHVLNHQRFDTLNSFRSCENCEICQSYLKEAENAAAVASLERRQRGPKKTVTSPILSGRAFEKLEEDALETLEELDNYMMSAASSKRGPSRYEVEVEEAIPNIRAQVLQDVRGRNPDEMDARRGELLEVLDDQKNLWWKVRNSKGRSGWISVQDIYVLSVD